MPDHEDDHRHGITNDSELLNTLSSLLDVAPPPGLVWRAATVVLYSRSSNNLIAAQLHHVQDLNLPEGEKQLLTLAGQLIDRELDRDG